MQRVHQIPVQTPTLLPATTTNVYIVESSKEALIIDAGYEDEEAAHKITAKINELAIEKVKGIIITHHHRDHAPGAKYLVRRFNCPVMCHPLEAPLINRQLSPFSVQTTLNDGDHIKVGEIALSVVHAPGHTHGQINIWWAEEKLLFTGDNIVGEGTTWIGPPDGDLTDYLNTLHRLKSLRPRRIAPGHGPWVDDPDERIQFVINRRMEREEQILNLLAEAPAVPRRLVDIIYGETIHPSNHWVAEKTVIAHLEKLVKDGKVYKTNINNQAVFALK